MRLTPLLALFSVALACAAEPAKRPPNIVLLYSDDIGWGDLGCYGAKVIPTPNIDRLAAQGLRFTAGYCTSATCTPSRYSLLTGEYAWRRQGTGVLPGDANMIIKPGRPTLPASLAKLGYATGVVGKWHLGLGPEGGPDWNGQIKPGPLEIGFDHAFLLPATGDRVPCVYVEDRRVVGLDPRDPIRVSYREKVGNEPTGRENPELLRLRHTHGHDFTIINGVGRIGWMTGGKAALWKDEDMSDTFAARAVSFIERSAGAPFFLYLATHGIHVPRVPHPRFAGRSAGGTRGDAIEELDDLVAKVLATLDRLGLWESTIVVFLGDHGYHLGERTWWNKNTLFERSCRAPLLIAAPGAKPGVARGLVEFVDLYPTLAELCGLTPPAGLAGQSLLPLLRDPDAPGKAAAFTLVNRGAARGDSVRTPRWRFTRWSDGAVELYDHDSDPEENRNVATAQPEVVERLAAMLPRSLAR